VNTAVVARADTLRAYLEPLVTEAKSSTDQKFIAEVCELTKRALAELMPHHRVPVVNERLLEQLRWFLLLSTKRADPPWLEVAAIGLAFSTFHASSLDTLTGSIQAPEATEAQRRVQLDSAYRLMEDGRSVIDAAAYAWHRSGQPALAGQLIENLAGSLFDAERSVTGIRAACEDSTQEEQLAAEHLEYIQTFPSQDLPDAQGMSFDEANVLYSNFFREQIGRTLALPRHLHMRAASMLSCSPQLAAVESERDVVYLVATPAGSAAIRYQSTRSHAAETISIDIEGVTSNQVSDWIAALRTVYDLYRDNLINGEHLDRVLTRLLSEIGTRMIAPIFAVWPTMQRFAFVPVGEVSALPLYTALVGGRPACAIRDFTVAPSAQTLHASAMFPAQQIASALVVSDPSEGANYLWHTVSEVDRVARVYGTSVVGPQRSPPRIEVPLHDHPTRVLRIPQTQPVTASNDMWSEFSDGIARSVVHFSCHGLISEAPAPNAYLCVGEGISLTDFLGGRRLISPGGVVVLSACSVGAVVTSFPSELIGFPAVLLGAGVRTLIAPVWPVLDSTETVDFVVGLHQLMKGGLSPSAALSRAIDDALGAGVATAVWGVFSAYGQ